MKKIIAIFSVLALFSVTVVAQVKPKPNTVPKKNTSTVSTKKYAGKKAVKATVAPAKMNTNTK